MAIAFVACSANDRPNTTAPDAMAEASGVGDSADRSATPDAILPDGPDDTGALSNDVTSGPPPDAGAIEGSVNADAGAIEGGVDAQTPFVMAPHPDWPQLPLMSMPGTTLMPMKLVSIGVQGDPLADMLFAFGDALVKSAWWTTIGQDYGVGPTAMTNAHVTGPSIPPNMTRTDPQNPGSNDMSGYIQSLIRSGAAPARDDNAMYLLYLPPGIAAYDKSGASNTYCQFYGGYHGASVYVEADGGMTNSAVIWGFVQRCAPSASASDLDTLTLAASHEIAEAATDTLPGYGWTFAAAIPQMPPPPPWTSTPFLALGGENGDMCEGTQWTEGAYKYQRIWSNSAAAHPGDPCLPAWSNVPYVNASVPKSWYSVAAGSQVQIPVTGFSDRPTADWLVYPIKTQGNDSGSKLTATITASTSVQTSSGTTATTNNGRMATLAVSAASGTPSGTWTLIEVTSQPQTPNGGDKVHFWLLGVYVP
ncbi:MAG TPA: hypothetical protein VN894_12845 [Polyangiaceae bacterium]|nr:hypothetical protein [Polyangiaceae bacterium]